MSIRTSEWLNSRVLRLIWGYRFFFSNGLLLALLGTRYFFFGGQPESLYAWFYFLVTQPGHFVLISLAAYLLLWFPVCLLTPLKRTIYWWAIIIATATVVGVAVDTVVFSQYRFHISGFVLALLFGGAADEIFNFSVLEYSLVAGGVLFVFLLELLLASFLLHRRPPRKSGRAVKASVVVLLLFVLGQMGHAWADATYYAPVTKLSRFFPVYYPLTAKRFLEKQGWIDLSRERQSMLDVANFEQKAFHYPQSPLVYEKNFERLNLLIICIDSWRFDMLNKKVTPNIDKFAKKSIRFTAHRSGGNSTQSGIFSLFYGLPPSYWDTVLSGNVGSLLVDSLQKRGYQFGIYSSSKLTSPPFDRTAFRSVPNLPLATKGESKYERDSEVVRLWNTFLDQRVPERPFFGFLFLDAVHGYNYPTDGEEPFVPVLKSINHLALSNDFDPVPYLNKYKNALYHVDKMIGSVIDNLQTRGLLHNTVVLITGDHGEEFNDNKLNFWGHGSNFTKYQIDTPLVLHWPGKDAGVVDYRTSHLDIVPTLMKGVVGIANDPADYSSGKLLWNEGRQPWSLVGSYFNFAIVEDDRITVTYPSGNYEVLTPDNKPSELGVNMQVVAEAVKEVARFRTPNEKR